MANFTCEHCGEEVHAPGNIHVWCQPPENPWEAYGDEDGYIDSFDPYIPYSAFLRLSAIEGGEDGERRLLILSAPLVPNRSHVIDGANLIVNTLEVTLTVS